MPVLLNNGRSPAVRQAEYAVTLLDVGASKTSAFVVGLDREGNLLRDVELSSIKDAPTQIGVKSHYDAVAKIVRDVQAKAGSGIKILPVVCVGSPGRFIMKDGVMVMAPGSAENLASTPGEFNNINPKAQLEERLGVTVFVDNDAIAQMSAALGVIKENKPELWAKLKGQKVAYIGPGTGLGGGFAEINDDGAISFHTDGHIYDVMIPTVKDLKSFPFKLPKCDLTAQLPVNQLKAEDILSGRAVRQIACALERAAFDAGGKPIFLPHIPELSKIPRAQLPELLRHNSNDSRLKYLARDIAIHILGKSNLGRERAWKAARQLASIQGKALGALVQTLNSGEIVKSTEQAQWKPSDKEFANGITNFIIGGSLLTRGIFGEYALLDTKGYLDMASGKKFNLIPMTGVDLGEIAALGAYSFAPKEAVLQAITKVK